MALKHWSFRSLYLVLLAPLILGLAPIRAQTSGATAPEVVAFEPVDITDLVNLSTGDFNYALPVLSIPGAPGGAYPLSLSYRGGVLYDQEASWVGLGWNLTPGSIARAVRGHPDDFKDIQVTRSTNLATIYGYTAGLNYGYFSAGIAWDNHGGFGGSLGVSYTGDSGAGVSVGFSYYRHGNGETSTGITAGLAYSSGNATAGISYSTQNGIGASLSYAADLGNNLGVGLGVDVSKQGGVNYDAFLGKVEKGSRHMGISLGSETSFGASLGRGRPLKFQSANINHFGTGVRTSTTNITYLYFSLGFSKTKVSYGGQALATGMMHLPNLGERPGLISPDSSRVEGSLDEYYSQQPFESYNRGLDRIYTNGHGPTSLSFDFHLQDYQAKTQQLGDSYELAASYEADYMAPAYDLFNVAAQGLGGTARILPGQRGFIKPGDAVMKHKVDGKDNTYYYPYWDLFHEMAENEAFVSTNQAERDFFNHIPEFEPPTRGRWLGPEGDQPNMTFLDDAAYLSPQNRYQRGAIPGSEAYGIPVEHRSKRIQYELGSNDTIETIRVTKADGLRYVFGRVRRDLFEEGEFLVAGAAPKIGTEERLSRSTEDRDGTDMTNETLERTVSKYAYAWYLAAVESPDYVDQTDDGYTPDDFGTYVAFRYQLASENFEWRLPWPTEPDSAMNYILTGFDLKSRDYQFEASSGKKELYYPYMAETKTHVAFFDTTVAGQRQDGRSCKHEGGGVAIDDSLVINQISQAQDVLAPNQISELAAQLGVAPDDHPKILMLPLGFHRLMGLTEANNVVDVELNWLCMDSPDHFCLENHDKCKMFPTCDDCFTQWGDEEVLADLIYKGTLATADYDIFVADFLLTPRACESGWRPISIKVNAQNAQVPTGFTHGMLALDSIRLYNRSQFLADTGVNLEKPWLPYFPSRLSDQYLVKVVFDYDSNYPLGQGMPNSVAPNQGRLTLSGVRFFNGGNVQGNEGYRFSYYNLFTNQQGQTLGYDRFYNKDPWGFLSTISDSARSLVDYTRFPMTSFFDGPRPWLDMQHQVPIQALWSLKSIKTPLGSEMTIEYDADQYSYVQDLVAVAGNALRSRGYVPESGPVIETLTIQDRALLLPDGAATPYAEFLDALRSRVPVDLLPNHWDQQVIFNFHHPRVPESGSFFGPDDIDRFILPIEPSGNSWRFKDHPALRDCFIILAGSEEYQRASKYNYFLDSPFISVAGIPVDSQGKLQKAEHVAANYQTVTVGGYPYEHLYISPNLIGEPGGGLRVKAIALAPADPDHFEGQYRRVEYNYTDPVTGLESGVIFSDPVRGGHNLSRTDTRLIRSELHPYLNFAGSQVNYEFVSTMPVQLGLDGSQLLDLGKTLYQFHSPRSAAVSRPFGVGGVESGFSEVLNQMDTTVVNRPTWEEKLPPQPEIGWKLESYGQPITFRMEQADYKWILNNSALIGSIKTVRNYTSHNDSWHMPFSRSDQYYEANYPLGELPIPVETDAFGEPLRVGLNSPPQLTRFGLDGQQKLTFQPHEVRTSGAFHEKSHAVLLRNEGNPEYIGRFFYVDEVNNFFRHSRKINREFRYETDAQGNPIVKVELSDEQEHLLFDYYTGAPSLTRASANASDQRRHAYNLNITAHQLGGDGEYDPLAAHSLRQLNQLTQAGLSLSILAPGSFQPGAQVPENLLADLFDGVQTRPDVTVVGGEYRHWRRPHRLGGGPTAAWVNDATYAFSHETPDLTSLGWSKVPLNTVEHGDLVQLDVPIQGEGRWLAAGQNTRFDQHLNVLEYRDRRNQFSSAQYDADGRYVLFNAANAQLGQVFYEGFEDESAADNAAIYRNPQFTDGLTPDAYRANFAQVYTGIQSFKGGNYPLPTQVSPVVLHPTSVTGDTRSYHWLSFYVKAADPQSTVQITWGGSQFPAISLKPKVSDDTLVSAVDQGWVLVRKRLPGQPGSGAAIDLPSGAYLDDVAIYPARDTTPGGCGKSDAVISHFSYHPHHRQVTSMTDGRGRTLRYEYNRKGELFRTYDVEGKLIQEYYKSYAGQRLDGNTAP